MSLSFPEDASHPAQTALRTYGLALALSVGPAIVTALTSSTRGKDALIRALRAHLLNPRGFPFAMTVAIGGGSLLASLKRQSWEPAALASQVRRSLACNAISSFIGVLLLRSKSRVGKVSGTLDVTLLLFVRALDSAVQSAATRITTVPQKRNTASSAANPRLLRETLLQEKMKADMKERVRSITGYVDAFVFWACASRIMWVWFYAPFRLPPSYVRWIAKLANLDQRVIDTLKAIRRGEWSYETGSTSHTHLLTSFAKDLKLPVSWGDPVVLPARGVDATAVWKRIGVQGRNGVGGMPCEIVHGGLGQQMGFGAGCTTNALIRWAFAFLQSVLIYLPAHLLPVLLTRPQTLLLPSRLAALALSVARSAAFLSTFVGGYWYSVCLTRSLVLAKLSPWISHDFWDGPFGCVLAGSLACGGSIWIEESRRRGEMALYVLPKALRACLSERWLRSGKGTVLWTERLVFVASLTTLLTTGAHQPESLRGLSRWTLSFILKGPNAGFWRRKRDGAENSLETTVVPTAIVTPHVRESSGE